MASSAIKTSAPFPAKPANPWTRQPEESTKAYEAFCLYRDLGSERSYAAVGRETSDKLVETNKQRHNWHVRAIAYDDYLEEQTRKRVERQRLEMAERQARIGRKMQDVALTALDNGTVLPESVQDIARLVDVGVKVERLACGESTENVQEKQIQIVWSGAQPKWAPKVDGDSADGHGAVSAIGDQKELPDSVGAGIPHAQTNEAGVDN